MIIKYKQCIYIPRDTPLCIRIIRDNHDTQVARHKGHAATKELILRRFWWPGMTALISQYVAGCETCQTRKTVPQKREGLLCPHDTPPFPWHIISVDPVGPLPLAQGYDFVCTIVD